MRRQAWIYAAFLTLFAVGWASGGEPPRSEPRPDCFVGQLGPAGGWFPYGGGC